MRRLILFGFLSLVMTSQLAFGQGAVIWHFGDNARLDFNSAPPIATCNSGIETINNQSGGGAGEGVQEGTAGVTTTTGQDLFYTNGVGIWDRNGNLMPGGNHNMFGGSSSVTSALIVPDPSDTTRFVIFSVDAYILGHDIESNGLNGIHYTVIDMDLNGGLGDVVPGELNNSFLPNSRQERLTAVPKSDGTGFWMITIANTNAVVRVYEFTASGITGGATPTVISQVNLGPTIGIWSSTGQGTIKANQSGNRIALTTNGTVAMLNFNASNGALTSPTLVSPIVEHSLSYGVEFSPDNNTLYATDHIGKEIFAYDLTAGNIPNSQTLVATTPGLVGNIQIGPDQKIYVAYTNSGDNYQQYLGVINDPDNFSNPNYDAQGVTFPCSAVYLGLPTFLPSLIVQQPCLAPSTATLTGQTDFCDGGSVVLSANQETGYWYTYFDGTGAEIDDGFELFSTTVSASGDYSVRIADALDTTNVTCRLTSADLTVTEHQDPVVTGAIVGSDTVCDGATGEVYTLNPASYDGYNWAAPTNGASNTTTTNESATVSFAGVSAPADVTLSLTVEEVHGAATCESAPFSRTVHVEGTRTVSVAPALADVACNSTGNTFTISNYLSSSNYTATGFPAGWSVNITGNTVTYSVDDNSGTITIEETTSAGCPSNTASHTVTVLGCGLEADFTNVSSLCAGDTVTFTSTSNPGNGATITSYSWTLPSELVGIPPLDQQSIQAVINYTGTTPLNVSVSLEVGNDIGMTDDTTITDVFTINPLPGAITINQSGLVCEGEQAIFKVSPYDPLSTYTWGAINATKGNEAEDSLVVTNGAVDYTVFVTETNQYTCVGVTDSIDVVVETTPVLTVSVTDMTVNCNSTGNFFLITSYNVGSTYDVLASPPNSNVTVQDDTVFFDVQSDAGNITIQETTANSCVSASVSVPITVVGCGLRADFVVETSACSGDTVTFRSTSDPGAGATITDYNWTFPSELTVISALVDSSEVTAVLTNSGTGAITISVGLEIITNALQTADTLKVDLITINPLPSTLTIDWNGLVCQDEISEFAVNPSTVGSVYEWGSDNGTFASNLDSATATNGTSDYSVWVYETNQFACLGDTARLDVSIETNPVLSVDPQSITATCNSTANLSLIQGFDALSTYNVDAATNGVSATIVSDSILIDVADQDGTVTISQSSANGCPSNTVDIDLSIVGCGLIADFEVDVEACAGDTILFRSTSDAGNGATITNYDWTFPSEVTPITSPTNDDSIYAVVNNTTQNVISVTATLEITTSAGLTADTVKADISSINPLPEDLTLSVSGGRCPGDTSTFDFTPYNANSSYIWDPAGVEQRDSINVIVNGANDYTVSVFEINQYGCRSTSDATIDRDVSPSPSNIQGIFGETLVCQNGPTDSVYTYVVSADNATDYVWNLDPSVNGSFPNGNTDDTLVVHFLTNPGENVELSVTISNDACATDTTLTTTVLVDHFYTVDYDIPNVTICEEDDHLFVLDTTVIGSDDNTDYSASIQWFVNGELRSDSISVWVEGLEMGDEVSVIVTPLDQTCYSRASDFTDTIVVDVINRPGGILAINDQEGEYDMLNVTAIEKIDLSDTYVTDRTLLGIDPPIEYQWFYFDTNLDAFATGDMVPTTPVPFNQGTPPTFDGGIYSVDYYMVTTNGVCYDTSIAVLNISLDVFIPDAFSPNGDNSFDTWIIENIENYPSAQIQVFNRWGNEVYNPGQGVLEGWTGELNGEILPTGTYFYIVKLTDEIVLTGDVSLLK